MYRNKYHGIVTGMNYLHCSHKTKSSRRRRHKKTRKLRKRLHGGVLTPPTTPQSSANHLVLPQSVLFAEESNLIEKIFNQIPPPIYDIMTAPVYHQINTYLTSKEHEMHNIDEHRLLATCREEFQKFTLKLNLAIFKKRFESILKTLPS